MRLPHLSRRQAAAAIVAAAGLGAAARAMRAYADASDRARRRVSNRSEVIATRFGALEYAVAGEGPPLLMIHGTGGGFDQGLSFSEGVARRGVRIIAPSRFGYLRSDFPSDPSAANQADAFVALLDHLDVGRVAVAGGSAGALSAAEFAVRYPGRCSALVLLVPAANVDGRDPVEMGPLQLFAVRRLLASDRLFWAALNTIPDRLVETLLATDRRLLAAADPGERARAYRILEELMPIGERARGMLNDARLAGSPARTGFGRIAVPTLVISAEDDRFGTAATSRAIAAAVPGARLVVYPSGGHIWIGRQEELSAEVADFVSRTR